MKLQDPLKTVNELIQTEDKQAILKNERCCGESGTLAVTRPDISTQIRFRKQIEMEKAASNLKVDFTG
jgi:Fe-S oxidoreductase